MELWEQDYEDDDELDHILFPSGGPIQEEDPAHYENIDYSAEEREQIEEEEEYYYRSQEEEYVNRTGQEQEDEEYVNRTEQEEEYINRDEEDSHREEEYYHIEQEYYNREEDHNREQYLSNQEEEHINSEQEEFYNSEEDLYNEAEYGNHHYSMDNDDFPFDAYSIEDDDFSFDGRSMAESFDSMNQSADLIDESFHSMNESTDSMSPASRSNQSLEIIDLDSYQLTPQQIIDLTAEETEISQVPNSQPFHHQSLNASRNMHSNTAQRTTNSNNAQRTTNSNNAQRTGFSTYSRIAQRTGPSPNSNNASRATNSNNASRATHSNNTQRNGSSASRFLFSPFMALNNIPWNSLQASQLRNSTFPIDESSSYEQLLRLQERIGEVKERGASEASIAAQLPKFRYSTRFPSSSCATASQAKNFFSPRKPSATSKSVNSTPKANKQEKENCALCLEEFNPQNVCRETNCGHLFHSKCIENWLKRIANCPICRGEALKR